MENEQAQTLARQADKEFTKGNYGKASEHFKSLLEKKATDKRVLHNAALNSFFLDDCADPRGFVDTLEAIHDSYLEQVNSAQISAAGNEGNISAYAEDYDGTTLLYNLAVVYCRLKQFAKARDIALSAYGNIESMEDDVAARVCLLVAHLCLRTKDIEKATEVLVYMEKKCIGLMASDVGGDKKQEDKDDRGEGTFEQQAVNSLLYVPPPRVNKGRIQLRRTDATDWKTQLYLHKAMMNLCASNLKLAKREIKAALNTSSQDPAGLFLKASLEFQRQNFRKSLKLLSSSYQTSELVATRMLYLNNLGCIQDRLGSYETAAFYFSKALEENDSLFRQRADSIRNKAAIPGGLAAGDSSRANLGFFYHDKKCEIMYNLGIQLLQTGKPSQAFCCFQSAKAQFFKNPRLWIRMGECCVAVYSRSRRQTGGRAVESVNVIGGRGRWRRVAIRMPSSGDMKGRVVSEGTEKEFQFPGMSMEDAAQYFERSLDIICQLRASQSARESHSKKVQNSQSEQHGRAHLDLLEMCARVNLAFTYLTLDDPHIAATHGRKAVDIKGVTSPSYSYVVQLYLAEALCRVNDLEGAKQVLNIETVLPMLEQKAAEYQQHMLKQEQMRQQSGGEASNSTVVSNPQPYSNLLGDPSDKLTKMTLMVNLACVFLLQDHLVRAKRILTEARDCEGHSNHPSVLVGLAYLHIRSGELDSASRLLRTWRDADSSTDRK